MPDIPYQSDLLLGVMNLLESEHHARFSFLSTNNEKWLDELEFSGKLRAKYMKLLEKEEDSQLHCYCKHILSASFRFFEVGDKFLRNGERDKAVEYYYDGLACLERFFNLNFTDEKEKSSLFDNIKQLILKK